MRPRYITALHEVGYFGDVIYVVQNRRDAIYGVRILNRGGSLPYTGQAEDIPVGAAFILVITPLPPVQ